MTWAHWVLILVPPLWGAFMIWILRGGLEPDGYCDCRDCADALGTLEVWLEQPVREACELSFDEEIAWQRIRAGA